MPDDEQPRPLPTGNGQIDAIIAGLIAVYKAVFPERIRGYYLTGSYVAGGLTPLSDLDLLVLFKGAFADDEERDRARRLNGPSTTPASPPSASTSQRTANKTCRRSTAS